MIKKITLITLALLTAAATAFSHTADYENAGTNQYKKIRLFSDVYQNSDLSSIRLRDANGKNIPYFINSNSSVKSAENAEYPLSLIDSYVKDDLFYFDYKLAEDYKGDVIATGISFESSNNNFAKQVTVYGGYDNRNWEFVTGNMIYKIDGNSALNINFTEENKYTHYRLELQNNLEKISFSTAKLIYNKTMFSELYFTNMISPKFEVEEISDKKETHIKVSGISKLRLKSIDVISDSIFQRTATVGNISKEIYNLNFEGQKYMDRGLDLNGYTENEELLTVVIQNGDDEPIEVKTVSVNYYVDELIFESTENVTLEFGGDLKKPEYDIAKSKDEILKLNIDEMKFLSLNMGVELEEVVEEKDYTIWFNITIVVVAVLLAVMFLLKLRKK